MTHTKHSEKEVEELNATLAMFGFEPLTMRELTLMENATGKDIEERWLNALLNGTEGAK